MKPGLKEFVAEWLLKAEHDLATIPRLLEIEPMILDGACFHCQQAIEKSLKAFLHYKTQDVKKTHSITYLLGECSFFDPVFSTVDPQNINVYAVNSRYPFSDMMPDADEARAYYRLAIEINAMVKERLIFPA